MLTTAVPAASSNWDTAWASLASLGKASEEMSEQLGAQLLTLGIACLEALLGLIRVRNLHTTLGAELESSLEAETSQVSLPCTLGCCLCPAAHAGHTMPGGSPGAAGRK